MVPILECLKDFFTLTHRLLQQLWGPPLVGKLPVSDLEPLILQWVPHHRNGKQITILREPGMLEPLH